MYPLNRATGALQAAREAEYDVNLLLLASRKMSRDYWTHLHKYVAVALLAYLDAVRLLAGSFFRQHANNTPADALDEIKARKKAMEQVAAVIEEPLRDDVRNIVSAHREQQTVESVRRTHHAVTSPAMRELLETTRAFLDAMEKRPVWVWGRSRYPDGVIAVVKAMDGDAGGEQLPGPDGFRLKHRPSSWVVEDEREFKSYDEGCAWAEAFWPMGP